MKKITLFLFSLFCVLTFTVNAQDFTCDDGSTIPSSYLCDGSIDYGNAGWGPDCADGSDEVLATCCDLAAPAYAGLCDGDGDGNGDGDGEVVDPVPACEDGLVELAMFDSWGDGWNGAELIINGAPYFLGDGSEASTCVALEDCNTVEWLSGSYDGETSWTLGDVASGASGSGTGVFGDGCVSGCSDETAENYNADADIADDSLCEYAETPGCIDETACNYNADATMNDGSCVYFGESCDLAIEAFDGANAVNGTPMWYYYTATASGTATITATSGLFTQAGVFSSCELNLFKFISNFFGMLSGATSGAIVGLVLCANIHKDLDFVPMLYIPFASSLISLTICFAITST